MTNRPLGPLLYSFFEDYLKVQKGLRPASLSSYRDTLRLFLAFVATDTGRRLTRLDLSNLTAARVLDFLRHLEARRQNHVRTRNHRLTALRGFFAYLASRVPEALAEAQRVAAIPNKRVAPPETGFLERDEIDHLFAHLPTIGRAALRNRALLLFLYNTGARVQEVADLRRGNLRLEPQPGVRLHGKGDKWRHCPLWPATAQLLTQLLAQHPGEASPETPVFASARGRPLTRFGIYKIVRRLTPGLHPHTASPTLRSVSPHTFRHTTAAHLLEAGVELNVIRGWLGHVSLDTTNRYAEINLRAKQAALEQCQPPDHSSEGFPRKPVWRDDQALLQWLASL
jgi:site-specific recombinase XerD